MSVNKMVGIKPPSPKKIWRFSSAHFYREVISQINNLWYNILEVIIKGWVVDHRERAESIVSWSGLHLKYNAIFFYAGAGESASCQFFAASSERSATFFTPRVQWKLWKVHLNYPIDTCGDGMLIVQTSWSEASCECETWHGRDGFNGGWEALKVQGTFAQRGPKRSVDRLLMRR